MIPVRETGVKAIDYLADDQVTLYLSFPNIEVTMPVAEMRDPQKVSFWINRKFGPRHELNGISFFEMAKGRRQRRWEALIDEAPFGMNGEFTRLDGTPTDLKEVLRTA